MQVLRSENTGSLNSSSGALRHAYAPLHMHNCRYPLGGVGALALCVPVLLPTIHRWKSTPWAHIRVPQVQVPVYQTPYWQSALWMHTTNSVWQGGCSVWARQMLAESCGCTKRSFACCSSYFKFSFAIFCDFLTIQADASSCYCLIAVQWVGSWKSFSFTW